MKPFIGLFVLMSLSFNAFAHIEGILMPWPEVSEPTIMSDSFEYNFNRLPLRGSARDGRKFWSGDYWANKKGSINIRWNLPSQRGFDTRSFTKNEVLNMTMNGLSRLSPSEKFDLLNGRYHYPLKEAVSYVANPRALDWEGICHGWAPATLNHNEPKPKVLMNPDGLRIPFGSSDIKALLSYYYAHIHQAPNTFQMGRRCFNRRGEGPRDQDCFEDLNAGSFHIVLTNKIGKERKGFIADIERFDEVWNHPVHSYESYVVQNKRPNRRSAQGTVRVIQMKTTIGYTDESANSWSTIIGTDLQLDQTEDYEYDLDINSAGEIIGGEWISRNRPDFLWTMPKVKEWGGEFFRLRELLNDNALNHREN